MLHFVILRVCIFNNSTIIPLILWLPPGLDWDKISALAFWLRQAHYFMIINTTDLYTLLNMYNNCYSLKPLMPCNE